MSLKDRLALKSAGIAQKVEEVAATREGGPAKRPVTMPGQLGAFRIEAQEYQRKIDALEAELQVARGNSSLLPIAALVETAGLKRKLSDSEYAELKANLAHNELINPIIVRPIAGGNYEILAGYNRVQAYRDLGRTAIEAIVRDFDDAAALRAAFYSNLLAPSLPDYEKYLGFRMMMQSSGLTQEQIAEESGISDTKLSRLLQFGQLPTAALDLIASNPHCIGDNTVEVMASAVKAGRSDRVLEAIAKLATNGDFKQTQAIAYVQAPTTKSPVAAIANTIKLGGKKFCEIKTRNGVIGIHFKDGKHALEWQDKIEAFIRTQLKTGGDQ